jgi:hypothetical protein
MVLLVGGISALTRVFHVTGSWLPISNTSEEGVFLITAEYNALDKSSV